MLINIIVGAVFAGIIIIAFRRVRSDVKNNKCSCGSSCNSCSAKNACHK